MQQLAEWIPLLLAVAVIGVLVLVACATRAERPVDDLAGRRRAMVETQIIARGLDDARVIAALQAVERHRFVPAQHAWRAYEDRPLPIGHDQTISQPYVVAFMTHAADVQVGEKVLEIGTGSGYQAAVLAELGARVLSIEIVEPLAREAGARLAELGYDVRVRAGDGYAGWPEEAPFDAIVVTAAPPLIPQPLLDQLAAGGRLIAPVGRDEQDLVLVRRTADGFESEQVLPVRFVPMTGEAQERR